MNKELERYPYYRKDDHLRKKRQFEFLDILEYDGNHTSGGVEYTTLIFAFNRLVRIELSASTPFSAETLASFGLPEVSPEGPFPLYYLAESAKLSQPWYRVGQKQKKLRGRGSRQKDGLYTISATHCSGNALLKLLTICRGSVEKAPEKTTKIKSK